MTSDALDFGSSLWVALADSSLDLVFFDDRIQGSQFASMVLGVVDSVTVNVNAVPEPDSLVLFGTGAVTLLARARRNSSRRC